MTAYFLGIVVETDNLAALKNWASEKSIEPPIVRPLVAGVQERAAARPNVGMEAAAHRVFDHWRQVCNHPRAVPGNRLSKVKSRMREGFTEEQLKRACDGSAKQPTVVDGRKYDDLELICRSASKVEDYMSRADGGADDQRSQLRRFAA